MKEVVKFIILQLYNYAGRNIIIILFCLSLMYIILLDKHKRKSIAIPTIILLFLILNPILYLLVWKKIFDTTYWRSFWMIPILPTTAYVLTSLIKKIKSNICKCLFLIGLSIVLFFGGNYMYRDNTNFIKTYNQYKIPQEVIDIADVILSKDENPTVVVPSQFYSYIRQYSSSIKLLYGRDSEGYVQLSDGDALTLSNLVSDNNNSDSPTVARLLRNNQCKFFVVSNDDFSDIVNYGFEILCSIDGYTIYHDVQNFNEYTLHIIKGENNAFLSLTDIYKRLAIIDGGAINNYNIIKQYILDNGQSVNQWLITNTNSNYSGSAIKVLDSDNNIKVGNLYAANVISTRYKDYVNQNSINLWPYDSICYYQTLDWLFRPVLANDNIQLLDTNTQILNTYTDSDTNGNLILNGSVIFKFGNEYNDSFLYVSDITSEQLEDMFSKYSTEELSAKYLIINNSEISDYSDLIDEVHPQKVYDLKENIPIDINLHINK